MNAEQPPLLWHYTAFEGLRGIVTEGELIASSLAYLNDTEEFQYTIKPLLDLVESSGTSLSDLMRGVNFQSIPSLVKAFFRQVRGQNSYVTCFSKERDDLSQWRSYTPRPPGFSIGFHPGQLQAVVKSAGFEMLECRYPQPDELHAGVRAAYEATTAGMDEERKTLPVPSSREALEAFTDKWGFNIVKAITKLAPKNKHPKFASEKEVRLHGYFSHTANNKRHTVQYRLSGSLVVPYLKIPARPPNDGPSPIKVILVGPCPHQDAVIAATRHMCVQYHVRADVLPSTVPYRNW